MKDKIIAIVSAILSVTIFISLCGVAYWSSTVLNWEEITLITIKYFLAGCRCLIGVGLTFIICWMMWSFIYERLRK